MLYKHKEIKKSDIQLKDKTFYRFKNTKTVKGLRFLNNMITVDNL